MVALTIKLFLLSSLAALGSAWDVSDSGYRGRCQNPRTGMNGCDKQRTIFVSATEPWAKFKTIQSAILSLPDNRDTYTILIGSGVYHEQLNVTRRGPTYLLGQTTNPKNQTLNTVNVTWAAVAGTGDNAYTSVLTVAPNLNASLTGSGPTGFPVPDNTFGCTDFRAYNLNFINNYAPYSATPSLALSISRANGGFYHSGFYSYQDTIYVGKLGNAYMKGCEIAGQTDFFYGFGTCWVDDSLVTLRSCGGGITAWKGTNTTYENKFGVYIVDSEVKKENSSLAIQGKCALGRPWNSQHRSIFANTYMDDSILPTGYIGWVSGGVDRYTPGVTLQAEYQNYGPGWNLTARLTSKFDTILDQSGWAAYSSPARVFLDPVTGAPENDKWIDYRA